MRWRRLFPAGAFMRPARRLERRLARGQKCASERRRAKEKERPANYCGGAARDAGALLYWSCLFAATRIMRAPMMRWHRLTGAPVMLAGGEYTNALWGVIARWCHCRAVG